jgi:hypothetical protein
VRDVDYTAEDASVSITVRAQTFERYDDGEHTIAAVFSINEELMVAAHTFELQLPRNQEGNQGGNQSSSQGNNLGPQPQPNQPSAPPATLAAEPSPQAAIAAAAPPVFADVRETDWFYTYVLWAFENGFMIGVGDGSFAPHAEISDAMVVTVLARIAEVDLSDFAGEEHEDIAEGLWYSETAAWAKSIGLYGDKDFEPDPPTPRGDLALMLVRFIEYLEIEYVVDDAYILFADADDMAPEENSAFQILHKLGIFKGHGDLRMDPQGSTTRAQFAALLQRVASLVGYAGES